MAGDHNPGWVRTAWMAVLLLAPVAFLNYLDRQMLASMKTSVMADITDIGMDENWGLMLGQFKWVYAFASPLGGWIADRFSRRLTICGSLFLWSAVTWLTSRVETFEHLLWARTLMGLSEAFYMPAALALIAAHHSGATRSRAIGAHQMGIYLGVIAGGFGGMVADSPYLGWRSAFTLCGVLGMVYSLPLLALLHDKPADAIPHNAPTLSASLPRLLLNGSFILLVLYFTLPALAGWIVRDWMPAILRDRYDISQGLAGVLASLPWQTAAIVFALIGGILADRLMARTERGRILVSALAMALIVPAIFGMGVAGNLGMAVAALVLFGMGWGMFDSNNMPILCQIVPANLRATGYGVMNLVSISCGGLAEWSFGKLPDQDASESLIFATFSALALVAGLLVLCIRPRSPVELEQMAGSPLSPGSS